MTLSFTALFVHGLRERKAVAGVNLVIERDKRPSLYWIVQSCYVSAIVGFGNGVWLSALDQSVEGSSLVDKLVMSTWGLAFLFAAMVMAIVFAIGLQTGVADSRFGNIERARNPVGYWAMEVFYVFVACLTTALGLGVFVLVFSK
jgi:hypothetical protein